MRCGGCVLVCASIRRSYDGGARILQALRGDFGLRLGAFRERLAELLGADLGESAIHASLSFKLDLLPPILFARCDET